MLMIRNNTGIEMLDPIKGRWQLDLLNGHPAGAGNEFIFADGAVTSPDTGRVVGSYDLEAGLVLIIIPMPAVPEEGPWNMVVRLLMPGSNQEVKTLLGTIEAQAARETLSVNACSLVRQAPDA
jgi:hypothetical protein